MCVWVVYVLYVSGRFIARVNELVSEGVEGPRKVCMCMYIYVCVCVHVGCMCVHVGCICVVCVRQVHCTCERACE